MTTKKSRIRLGPMIGPGTRLAMCDRDGDVTVTTVEQVPDGKPVPDGVELIHVDHPNSTSWQDFTTLLGGDGPAQVATEAYRSGYDRIFGKKPTMGIA